MAQHVAPSACIIAQVMGHPITSVCSIMEGMEELVASQIKKIIFRIGEETTLLYDLSIIYITE